MVDRKPRRRQPNMRQTTDAALAERDDEIWRLRVRGLSLRQIAAQVGLAPSSVHGAIMRGYEQRIYPKVDEVRALELERLDDWLCKLQPAIDQGDDKAINTALRISDRRAKLTGADAPTRVQAEVENVTPTPEVLARIAEARARVERRELEIKGSG